MTLNDLLPDLLQLSRDEMVQAIEILKQQVSTNEPKPLTVSAHYEVWSPTISLEAARILEEVLHADSEEHA